MARASCSAWSTATSRRRCIRLCRMARRSQRPSTVTGGGARCLRFHRIAGFWSPSDIASTGVGSLQLVPLQDSGDFFRSGNREEFAAGPGSHWLPAFSPDGRWIAYVSDESGRAEIYVKAFPGPGGRWQVSTGGGTAPAWSRARRELLFQALDRRILRVPYTAAADSISFGRAERWGTVRPADLGGGYSNHGLSRRTASMWLRSWSVGQRTESP